ncbi:RAMP superfamily protein (plasmid) [Picosynechococcus sp. PCC 7003]|uniref:RAMP superfamily CRISPR-associated protein n=1 Tax=Picosynechococcus sp. PCC 7003 TaxID=374981 RepID=UPI0008107631|nr:RAMP superfamily CRISPR-associated protein [Picosynechococcus sp. PCC 7003]ANV85874.1 RAMP superfamily protein [Picosynechococcus sp. PCC 7003]
MYTQTLLTDLLAEQHQQRGQTGLFKKGIFTLSERAKVGSFPHPDVETLVSAGEPCGNWKPTQGRPEDKRNVNENLQRLATLPLNGYIPGSSIRGLVRSWAKQHPDIYPQMMALLGEQTGNEIRSGKIEFLDAWPLQPTRLTLDIVNPQEDFQVLHQGQGTPLSHYTLGDGELIQFEVAIRGIPHRATLEDVATVWGWVEQALTLSGIGSRTASGYGVVERDDVTPKSLPNYSKKVLSFDLFSQGCYGASTQIGTEELRPSHWRGWLRSWTLRFLLGVMPQENAQKTLAELFGAIEPQTYKGCVSIKMKPGNIWGDRSSNQPRFFRWSGKLEIHAPRDILPIILPIVRVAASVGGVGRGWRRPLHIFLMNNNRPAARGSFLKLTHRRQDQASGQWKTQKYLLPPHQPQTWQNIYQSWLDKVRDKWGERLQIGVNDHLEAEVFSPTTCSVYLLPGPDAEPVDFQDLKWQEQRAVETRGDAMYLMYQENRPRNYKRNPALGGSAGGGGAHCSWVSIRRYGFPHPNQEIRTACTEVACLFLGGAQNQQNHVRSRFLRDLQRAEGSIHLFGR